MPRVFKFIEASPLDIKRFAKVLALLGSDQDGEAAAALAQAKAMLRKDKRSFTDVARLVVIGAEREHEADHLRKRVEDLEDYGTRLKADLYSSRVRIIRQEELERLRRAGPSSPQQTGSLKRTQTEIEAKMRAVLGDARLSILSDREIARRTGISPQTVGNWRRRLDAERAVASSTVHNGRKHAA
jgi:DNA-binding CsgD family transcriptional regulator